MAGPSQAIIPKARGMYAKRIQPAEYEELMRRRTVPEVATVLKKHAYFKTSLATFSVSDPHREQLEELLNMDIFNKYEELMRYDFSSESFSYYFLIECEVRELLRALHMLSVGMASGYIKRLPPFLEGHLRFDLFRVAEARSFSALLEALRFTPYHKVLRDILEKDPMLRDFPAAEAVFIRFYYASVFDLADKYLTGQEKQAVKSLFLQEAETYNLNVILRSRLFFRNVYTAEQINRLLLLYTFKQSRRKLDAMIAAPRGEMLTMLYGVYGVAPSAAADDFEWYEALGARALYRQARRVLHLSTAPSAAVAAFISLAKLERDNVVNVIEGVRYRLAPEKIRVLLRY